MQNFKYLTLNSVLEEGAFDCQFGYEEAVFMADSIKTKLGDFSTEQTLYLMYLAFKECHQRSTSKHPSRSTGNDSEHKEGRASPVKDFKSFIFRYIYFLREKLIAENVQMSASRKQSQREKRRDEGESKEARQQTS